MRKSDLNKKFTIELEREKKFENLLKAEELRV